MSTIRSSRLIRKHKLILLKDRGLEINESQNIVIDGGKP